MTRHLVLKFVAAIQLMGAVLQSSEAYAIDFILPGVEAKAAAGAGQTVSRGASSLFFNPANVILTQNFEPEADLSFANITYSYQNANTGVFEPAVLGISTPTMSFGLGWRAKPDLAVGFEVLPLGLGSSQEYFGAPVELSPGSVQALDVSRKEIAAKIAAGGAYRFLKRFTFGFGVIVTSERSSLRTKNAGTERIMSEASYVGKSVQPNLGLRLDIGYGVVLGFSFKTSVTRAYQGTFSVNTAKEGSAEDFQIGEYTGKAFDPSVLGAGVEWRILKYGFFADFTRKFWASGRTISKSGLGADPREVDLKSTNDFVLGSKLWFANNHLVQFAVGSNAANSGNGSVIGADNATRDVAGVQLGQIEAIPRTILSGGYSYKIAPGRQFETAMMLVNGQREIPAAYNQAGIFKLRVFITTVGCNFAL